MTSRKMVRDSIGIATAQFLVRALMILRTVLAARWLGPQIVGSWNALLLVMDYGALAPLGTVQGLDQRVPGRIVDGDPVALDRVKRAGITNTLVLSLIYGAGALGLYLLSQGRAMDYWGLAGLALAMLTVVLGNWAGSLTSLLRAHGNIKAVSLWFFLQGSIGAVLGLALIPAFGGWGLLYGWVAGTLIGFVWTRWESRGIAPMMPRISRESLALLRVGFPMFFFVGSALVIRNLDRLIILRYLGVQELGFYSLAVTAMTLLLYLPDSATFVFYPRLLQRFRASGDRPEPVRGAVISLLTLLTVVTPALGGLGYLVASDLIDLVLPNFFLGAPAVQIMCFTASAVAMTNLGSIVLMTLGRQMLLVPLAVVSVAAFAVADVLALSLGFGITGVAWATLFTYTAMGLTVLAMAFAALGFRPGEIARHVSRSLWGLLVAVALAMLLHRFVPWEDDRSAFKRIVHVLVASAAFVVAYVPLVAPQLRGLGLLNLIAEFHPPLAGWLRKGASVFGRSE